MPDRVNILDATCPPNTAVASPLEVPFTGMNPGIPRRVTIIIPPGHALLTGIALGYGHTPLIPENQPGFFTGDDEKIELELDNYGNGPPWSVFVCNLDYLSHSWQIRFELDEFRMGQPVTPTTQLSVQDIIKAGDDLALRTAQVTSAQAPDLTTSLPSDQLGVADESVTSTA